MDDIDIRQVGDRYYLDLPRAVEDGLSRSEADALLESLLDHLRPAPRVTRRVDGFVVEDP